MASELKNENEQNVSSLVAGIVSDAQELLKQQFELLKHEVRSDVRKVKSGVLIVGAGAGVAALGILLLACALALVLQVIFPELPEWACFAIVGAVFAAVGGGILAAGMSQLNSVNPLPEQTAEALKENVQWITNPK
jgi:hypothetical protein